MMLSSLAKWAYFILMLSPHVFCDNDCLCNYAAKTSVYGTPDTGGQPIGYLYELDCKPTATSNLITQNFYAVQFEKQVGYVKTDGSQIKLQTCPGNVPYADITNDTGTPYEYIGVGYNTLIGNPETRTDPGLKISKRIFQVTGSGNNVTEATSQTFDTCVRSTNRTLLHGSKSYQDELKSFVNTSPTHISKLQDLMFTYSPDFQALRSTLDNPSSVYLDFISSCKVGSARYLTEYAEKKKFTVSREFAKDVCALPSDFNAESYMHFLDKWGTSIVTSVDVGTRVIERYQTTPNQLFQHVKQTQPQLLESAGTYRGYPSSFTINAKSYANSQASNGKFGVAQKISLGTNDHPVPIALAVVPIYDALNWSYWQPIMDELTGEGVCSDNLYDTHLDHFVALLKTALNQYTDYKAKGHIHTALTDYHLQFPLTWPTGTYGLMQTAYGCPGANSHWSTGWRRQDTEDDGPNNYFSSGINSFLKGEFGSNNLKTFYCIKRSQDGSQYDQPWQKGSYCLLKYGSCPNGFSVGSIYWDDEDERNENSRSGTLPDGVYGRNTLIYYCCRNDASSSNPLFLPTDRPFVLLRFGNTCQTVHGMHVQDVFIRWDDEDDGNEGSMSGMHPYDDGSSKNHILHFCYYISSNSPSLIG